MEISIPAPTVFNDDLIVPEKMLFGPGEEFLIIDFY
jgi:hypothetical protein